MKRTLLVLLCWLLLSSLAYSQAADVAVLVGGIFTTDQTPPTGVGTCTINNPFCGLTVHTPSRISYEGALGVRMVNLHLASLHFDLPVIGTPTRTLVQGGFRQDYSTVFFTPGLRLKVSLPILSPFAVVGGGFAHYSPGATSCSPSCTGVVNASSSTVGVFEAGGGLEFGTHIPLLGFRAEARFFHAGSANFNGQNQVFAGAGLVLKF